MTSEKFAEWMTFLSEVDEEKLRSGKRLSVEGRVHYKGYWSNETPAIGISVMFESDIEGLKALVQIVDEKPVVDIFDVAKSNIETLVSVNLNGYINVKDKEFNKIERGDIVSAEVSIRTDTEGRSWLNGRNVELVENGHIGPFLYKNIDSSISVEDNNDLSEPDTHKGFSPRGTHFRHHSALKEARCMGLDDISNSEEQMHTMYWNTK